MKAYEYVKEYVTTYAREDISLDEKQEMLFEIRNRAQNDSNVDEYMFSLILQLENTLEDILFETLTDEDEAE